MDKYSLRLDKESKAVINTALNTYYLTAGTDVKQDVQNLKKYFKYDQLEFSLDEDQQEVLVAALRGFRNPYMRNYNHINRDIKRRCTIAWNLLQRVHISDFQRRMSNPRFQPCTP